MHTKLLAYGDTNKIKFLAVTVSPEIGWSDVKTGYVHREHSFWEPWREKKAETELWQVCVTPQQGKHDIRLRQGSGKPLAKQSSTSLWSFAVCQVTGSPILGPWQDWTSLPSCRVMWPALANKVRIKVTWQIQYLRWDESPIFLNPDATAVVFTILGIPPEWGPEHSPYLPLGLIPHLPWVGTSSTHEREAQPGVETRFLAFFSSLLPPSLHIHPSPEVGSKWQSYVLENSCCPSSTWSLLQPLSLGTGSSLCLELTSLWRQNGDQLTVLPHIMWCSTLPSNAWSGWWVQGCFHFVNM